MRASRTQTVTRQSRNMWAPWRTAPGKQEKVDLDQGKKLQEAAGNDSCPGRQHKTRR